MKIPFLSVARRLLAIVSHLGFNPLQLRALAYLPVFIGDIIMYRRLAAGKSEAFPLRFRHLFPILADRADNAGVTRSHYFIMDLFMASRVLASKPATHTDIGSRLDGFLAHLLAAGQPVTMVDVRPLASPPEGLTFRQADATHLGGIPDASIASLSTLHAVEHFGLGRYGDPINPEAHVAFITSLARVLKPGGRLYFATPIGIERLEFNAHRVFSPHTLHLLFQSLSLKPVETAVITTDGTLVQPANPLSYDAEPFACGLYILTKE